MSETLDLRVLSEVHEVGENLQIPSGLDFHIMKCTGYDHFEMVVEGYLQYPNLLTIVNRRASAL